MKTKTRTLAEKIQAITGESLVQINQQANEMVEQGLLIDREAALEFILTMLEEEAQHAWADAGWTMAVASGTQPADEES